MTDIVISEFMDPAAVERLSAEFDVCYDPDLGDQPQALLLLLQAANCRALIVRNRTQVRGALLQACQNLQVVGRLGIGLDNIDLEACRRRSIQVLPATGANANAVAEYVIAGILLLLRGAFLHTEAVLAGEWPRNRLIGFEANERQLGLVGFGAIARRVAARARALGMCIAAFDPFVSAVDPAWQGVRQMADFTGLLATSDVVSLHVPLTDATRHLVDAEALATMKPDALLINTARGGVVDEQALADALRSGCLGGALLDVFDSEPLAAGSHLIDVPRLLLTPHIAGITAESNRRVSAVTADNVRNALLAQRH